MPIPELSLCMIVRDEEAMLPDFLATVAGLWDELIAVDTGSRDGTVALLTAAGARVLHRKWDDDFAAARNASLAGAGGRWILFLDADERVTPALAAEIRALLRDERAGAATLVMRNPLPGGLVREANLLRLFRNDPAIRFEHRIHEDVGAGVRAFLGRTGLELRRLAGRVDHLGYVRQVAADRAKKERDLALLGRALQEDPDDFYCRFKTQEIARFWADGELWRRAAAATAARLAAVRPDLRPYPWSGELAALTVQGLDLEPAAALAWLEGAAAWAAPSAAWHLRRALLLEAMARRPEAREAFAKCLAAGGADPAHLTTVRPLLGLCRLAAADGDLPAAAALARRAVAAGPADPEALLALVTIVPLAEGAQALAPALADHLARQPQATVPAARALLGRGRCDLAAALLAPPAAADPEAAVGLLVAALCLGRDVDLHLDLPQAAADDLLRGWLRALDAASLAAVAARAPAVAAPFPWLAAFLRTLPPGRG